MSKYGFIYIHKNKINGHVYIGQSIQSPERRFRKGAKGLNAYKSCPAMYAALLKYGWENFETEILAWTETQEQLNALEEQYIKEYNSADGKNGYNTVTFSQGRGQQADTTKEKIRQIQLKRYSKMKKEGTPIIPVNKQYHKNINGIDCKECTKCLIYIPLTSFGIKKDTWDKLLHDCRECRKLAMREYRKLHPPKKLSPEEFQKSYEKRKQAFSEGQKRRFNVK